MATGSVSATYSEILALILIAVNLLFSILLHRLEEWAAAKHIYLQTVMRLMYRELMLLGLVSFAFLAVELSWKPLPENLLESFEFVHTLIFALAIFYALTVIFSNYASVRLSSRWQEFEDTSIDDYLQLKANYVVLQSQRKEHASNLLFHLKHWRRFSYLHDSVVFHDLRFQFVFYRHLPEDFHFTSYLRKVKATVYTHLVDIHWSLWAVAFVFEALDLSRRALVARADLNINPTIDGAIIVALSVFTIVLCFVLERKIRDVYRILTHNPATYYNDMELEDFVTESSISDHGTQTVSTNSPTTDYAIPRSGGGASVSSADETLSYIEEPEFVVNAEFNDTSTTTAAQPKLGLKKRFFGRSSKRLEDSRDLQADVQIDNAEQGLSVKGGVEPEPPASPEPVSQSIPDFLFETVPRARDDLEILAQSRAERSSIAEMSDDEHGDHAHAISFNVPYRHPGIGVTTLISKPGPPLSELSFRQSTDSAHGVRSMIPRQELERQRDRELSVSSRSDANGPRPSVHDSDGHRPSLAHHHQNVREAAQLPPPVDFPWWLLWIVPRLKRVAAPVERLFWFGSHRFFLWLVQLSLFLGTLLPSIMVATAAVSYSSFGAVHWTAFGIAVAALGISLFRSAESLKTYTYVINASSLVSEELVSEVVTRIVDKKAQKFQDEMTEISVTSSGEGSRRTGRRRIKHRK